MTLLSELPPGVLTVVGSHLSWLDVLSARASCTALAVALAPLLTRIRVPVVQWPRAATSQLAAAAGATSPQPTDFIAPAKQLSAALARLVSVSSVTLLLSPNTTATDLQQALEVVGRMERIKEVIIHELDDPDKPSPHTPRDTCPYVAALALYHLRHVHTLVLEVQSWTLDDIWQQVGRLSSLCDGGRSDAPADEPSGGGGSSSNSGRPSRNSSQTYLSVDASSCVLHTLNIVDRRRVHLDKTSSCSLTGQQLPATLRRLTTPLPGQYDRYEGKVVCSLKAAHEAYLAELAAGLSQLQSLTLTGRYEGNEAVFEGFAMLQELHCHLGQRFRSFIDDMTEDASDSAQFQLATRLQSLKHLELLAPATASTGCLRGVTYRLSGVNEALKLHWLSRCPGLQHLSAVLIQAGEDVSAAAGQLKSLRGRCPLPSPELLTEIAAVGSGLTSLDLHPNRLVGRLSRTPITRTIPAGRQLSMLTSLHSLTLMGGLGVLYMVPDPVAVWSELPALRCLKLQNVGMGYSGNGQLSSDRLVARQPAYVEGGLEASCRAAALVLWLEDLPCRQLQHLELFGYDIVLPSQSHTVPADTAAQPSSSSSAVSSQQCHPLQLLPQLHQVQEPALQQLAGLSLLDQQHGAAAGTMCSTGDLSSVTNLRLSDCSVLVLAAGSAADISAGRQTWQAPLRSLLSRTLRPGPAGASSRLRVLQLQSPFVSLSDVMYITCSAIGSGLRELHIDADGWTAADSVATAAGALWQCEALQAGMELAELACYSQQHWASGGCCVPQLPAGVTLGDVLEVAACMGRLQGVRCLELGSCQPSCHDAWPAAFGDGDRPACHPGVLHLGGCCALRALEQLHLTFIMFDIPSVDSVCWCCSIESRAASDIFPASDWQRLRRCLLNLRQVHFDVFCEGAQHARSGRFDTGKPSTCWEEPLDSLLVCDVHATSCLTFK